MYEAPPLECVHETVCAKMRCKLVSEVKANLAKLEVRTPRAYSACHLGNCFYKCAKQNYYSARRSYLQWKLFG